MSLESLQDRYREYLAEGSRLAGGVLEIPRRVAILQHLYQDSGGNHLFPLIAAHGALWAFGYFEMGGSLGRLIATRYFYNSTERIYRLGILREFAEKFRKVNRQVTIDAYANYHFTRELGEHADAERIVPADLLESLNQIHAARRAGRELSPEQQRDTFQQSFLWEQEVTVAAGVQEAIQGFQCRIMQFLCLRPLVRFAYFPMFRYLLFRDFGNKEERIEKGLRAFDLAQRAGPQRVQETLLLYGHMPRRFLADPLGFLKDYAEGEPA